MNSAPSCPIRIGLANVEDASSIQEQCLTAAEIEWRRWSRWQQERTMKKKMKKYYEPPQEMVPCDT